MDRTFFIFSFALIFSIAAAYNADASSALQFRAKDFSGGTWNAVGGGKMLVSHPQTVGWGLPVKSGGVVWFSGAGAGAVVSPLEFAFDDTNLVTSVYAVVICEATTPLATLVSVPCEVLIKSDEPVDVFFTKQNDTQTARMFETEFMGLTNSVSINGVATARIVPGMKSQLVEIRFEEPCMRNEIFIGGSAATPRWQRQWRGGICELLLFDGSLTGAQANAVKRYLSAKCKLSLPTESDDAVIPILRALGIDDGGVFATVVSVK